MNYIEKSFLKLTATDDTLVWVKPDFIVSLFRNCTNETEVGLPYGVEIVKEDVETINNMIENLKNK